MIIIKNYTITMLQLHYFEKRKKTVTLYTNSLISHKMYQRCDISKVYS